MEICIWDLGEDGVEKVNQAALNFGDKKRKFSTLERPLPKYRTIALHTNHVDCVSFFGNSVISKGSSGQILIWTPIFDKEIPNKQMTLKLPSIGSDFWFTKFDYNFEQKMLLVGDDEGRIYCRSLDLYKKDEKMHLLATLFCHAGADGR